MTQSNPDIVADKLADKRDPLARRIRLREFQSQLVERMQTARSGTQLQASQLGVMIGQTRWLLDLREAGEIISVGAITKVPLTQDWFLGLANSRGNLISVIDFARFQGMAPSVIDKESRIVAFAHALSFNSGLLVSRVMGLRNTIDMTLQKNDESVNFPWSAKRYLDRDSQVWSELNLSLVIQDPQFLHVGL
ncbi:MAG TPA: chemotaxis protein CheW [Burkholderiaceae bacterium]|nr:chemotaxis protein CheW [Burkholderiaceae bacterium]